MQRTDARSQQDPKLALGIQFQKKVEQGFLDEMANSSPLTWVVIDAIPDIDEVSATIERNVRNMLIPTTKSHQETK